MSETPPEILKSLFFRCIGWGSSTYKLTRGVAAHAGDAAAHAGYAAEAAGDAAPHRAHGLRPAQPAAPGELSPLPVLPYRRLKIQGIQGAL